MEASIHELVAEALRPGDELAAQAHDQQQRLAVRLTEGLVAELHTVGRHHRHRGILAALDPPVKTNDEREHDRGMGTGAGEPDG